MDLRTVKLDIEPGKLVFAWLLFAVSTLVFAGLFAVLLALSRTPVIQELYQGKNFVRVALVGHVDLSVVIWFLAFMGVLWVLSSTSFLKAKLFCPILGWTGFWVTVGGSILLTIATVFALGEPIFSNYVPVLTHPVFYFSLVLIGLGTGLTVINTLLTVITAEKPLGLPVLTFGMTAAGIAVIIGLLCFGIAYFLIPNEIAPGISLDPGLYFERLFWGGGHILQFANTIGMVTAWLLLAYLTLKNVPIGSDRMATLAFALYILFMLPAPFIFFHTDINGQTYKDSFTHLMKYGLGPSTAFFAVGIIRGMVKQRKEGSFNWADPAFSSLVLSMSLFALGGAVSLFIRGSNLKIPSHYHGVIGAVTTAFMGLTYYIIPLLGREVWSQKMAKYQPYLYATGQAIFVLGMFWAGAHGVPRKTYGTAQNLDSFAKTAGMVLQGIGGLIAVMGGASFVLNVLPSLLKKKERGQPEG
ncbi:MAG: cbb3-type cytochrome c oxidase subunit I [Deltaproteobacteria bacterium]|nr:cbb3-type cytochrome c oxidase subunit I [Deltaproteobacteria bacterium]